MTSRKDYVAIAEILSFRTHSEEVREVACKLASHFAQDNPRFDTRRFLAACNMTEGIDYEMAQDDFPVVPDRVSPLALKEITHGLIDPDLPGGLSPKASRLAYGDGEAS